MVVDDREKWDRRHAKKHDQASPSVFLQQLFQPGSSPIHPGKVLDIATGKGRNAVFLAERGFVVDAVDISEVALQEARKQAEEKGLTISFRKADLDNIELPEAAYDMVLNFNFLLRSLIPKIKKSLKLGGHVVFETFLIEQQDIGHPKNPAYLLGHNELLELFRDFRILYYHEGKFVEGEDVSYRATLFGQKV